MWNIKKNYLQWDQWIWVNKLSIVFIIVLILIVGAVMWKQRKDAANEKIEEFQAGSEEWEKKLEGISEASNLSMSGT